MKHTEEKLLTKEDLYKIKEELKAALYSLKQDVDDLKLKTEGNLHRIEKEIVVLKILLWVVIILSGLSAFPQLLNLLRVLK